MSIWAGFDRDRHPKVRAALDAVIEWYQHCHETGTAIVLAGNTGAGKSHIAKTILKAWGPTAQYVEEIILFDSIRGTYNGGGDEASYIRRLNRAELLIIDDVGTAYVKKESEDWLQEKYWRIFDKRQEDKKPTLLTTNLGLEELDGWIGKRASSRLMGMMGSFANYIDLYDVPDYRTGWTRG